MEIVSPPKQNYTPIDYSKLADYYNQTEVGGAVKMARVYNITLFKKALDRRGVSNDTDFQAYNSGDSTYVKRLTQVSMTKD